MAGDKIGNHKFTCCPYCGSEIVAVLGDLTILKIEDFQKRVKEAITNEEPRTR